MQCYKNVLDQLGPNSTEQSERINFFHGKVSSHLAHLLTPRVSISSHLPTLIRGAYCDNASCERAMELYQVALRSFEAAHCGADSVDTWTCSLNIGLLKQHLGRYSEALHDLERSYELVQKNTCQVPPRLFTWCAEILAGIWCQQNEFAKAIPVLHEAMAAYKQFPADDPSAVACQLSLARLLVRAGQSEDAIPLIKQVMKIYRKIREDTHPMLAVCLHDLALANESMGNTAAATANYGAALNQFNTTRGALGLDMFQEEVRACENYQRFLVSQGQIMDALEISEHARHIESLHVQGYKLLHPIPRVPVDAMRQVSRQHGCHTVCYSRVDKFLYRWIISPRGKIDFTEINLATSPLLKQHGFKSLADCVGQLFVQAATAESKDEPDDDDDSDGMDLTRLRRLLYNLCLKPFIEQVRTPASRVLYIIPHRELCCLPFGSLQPSEDHYVCQQYAVLISPTVFDQHRPAPDDGLLVSQSGRGIYGKSAQQLTLVTGSDATIRAALVKVAGGDACACSDGGGDGDACSDGNGDDVELLVEMIMVDMLI